MKMPKRTGKARVEKQNRAFNLQRKTIQGQGKRFINRPSLTQSVLIPPVETGGLRIGLTTWTGDISSIQLLGHTRGTYFSKSATNKAWGIQT
jgi:hypothetical protein